MELYLIDRIKENVLAFAQKVKAISVLLKIEPNWLMAVMWHESKLNSKVQNPFGSATGLIQFLSTTAKGLGTTIEGLKTMSNVQQLEYVYKYLKPYAGRMTDLTETYLAVFYPQAMGKPDSFEFPSNVVKWNPIFDRFPKDGQLTKGEIRKHLESYFPDLKKKV